MRFTNTIVLVTGASRGIGRACALAFAKEGATVIVNYNKSKAQAEAVAKECGNNSIAYYADVSEEIDTRAMITDIANQFGRIDVLINNAGIVFDVPFAEKNSDQVRATFDTNVMSVYYSCHAVYSLMVKQKSGVIVNISSTNGFSSCICPDSWDYNATKAAVIKMTGDFAKAFAPHIRVNCVAPGWVDTDINKELPKEYIKSETEKIFIQRFGRPEEIANTVLFLSSSDASFINGSTLIVDGGYR